MAQSPSPSWPTRYHRAGLWLLLAVVFIFGGVVELRSAFLKRRMTDADDFFRAAWAVRMHTSIYESVDTNGWHYNYPPFFAIALTPLANPPPGADRAGMLPYEVSVAVWYFFSVGCLALGVHWLASAVEASLKPPLASNPPRGCVSWWALRILPVLVCLPSIGRTLSRGQVNLVVLMLLCGLAAAKRRSIAGLCLAAAASIKVFPAYLGLYPLWRRDWRCIAGCVGGLVFCLVLVPMVALGPTHTVDSYKKYLTVIIGPAFGGSADQSRAEELLSANGTDNQSFKVLIQNSLHPTLHRWERKSVILPWVNRMHWILAALFTGLTLWFGRHARPDDFIYRLIFLGSLIVLMVPISPGSHTHYFVFALPLVMGLTAHSWERNQAPRLSAAYKALFGAHIAANLLSLPPAMELFKDLGLSLYGTMILWVAGLYALRQRSDADGGSRTPGAIPQ